MKQVEIKISGYEEAMKYLRDKLHDTENNEKKALSKAALFMQGEVKSSIAGHRPEPTSVDTGRFLNSVEFEVGADDAAVFTKIPYSKFLEYGTTRMTPRRHFNNSKDRNKNKIKEIFEGEIKSI